MATRKLQVEILGDSSSLQKAFGQAAGASSGFGSTLAKVGKAAALAGAAIGAGVGAGLVVSAKAAVDFEREMRNVNSIARLGDKDFKALGKSVTGMAAEVGQKPKVLAKGLYDIVSSGFKAADAVKVLRVSSKAATAGLTDTATASKAVTAALNAYHQGAGEARKVSDVLFQTVNKGVLTFEELSQQMGDLVPASAPLGVSLEEVGAGMATLTLQGVPAAEAATRMKNAMLSLAKPTPALSKLLKEQGFASGEALVKAEGFTGALKLLNDATHGSVAAQAKLTPEIRTLLGVVGLTGKNLKTYEANLRAMNAAQKGAGITAKVFAEQSKGVGVQWQKAAAALDVFKIQIGTALLPSIAKGLGALSGFLKKLNEAASFRAKINVVVDVGRGLFESLKLALLGGLVNVGDDVDVRMGFQNGLQQNLQKAMQGIDWASVGESMLAGFRKAFQTSVGAVDEVMGKISEAMIRNKGKIAEAAAVIAVSIFTTLLDPVFWAKHWDLALAVGLVVFRGSVAKVVGKMLQPLAKLGGDMVLAVTGGIEKFAPRIGQVLLAGLLRLPSVVGGVLGNLSSVVGKAFDRLGKLATFVARVTGTQIVIDAVARMAQAVGDKIRDIVNWFVGLGPRIKPALANAASVAYNAAIHIGEQIISGIIAGLGSLVSRVGGFLADKLSAAVHLGGSKKSGSGEWMWTKQAIGEPMAQGIADGITRKMSTVQGALTGGLTGAVAATTAVMKTMQGQLDAINARREAEDRASAVRDAMTAVAEARKKGEGVAAAEQALARAREDIVVASVTKRLGIETAHFDKLTTLIEARKSGLADAFGKLGEFAGRAFDAKTQKMLDKVSAKFDRLIAKANAWGDALTPAEQALKDLDRAEGERSRNQALSDAQAGGDPEAIRQAQLAIERAHLEDQANVERAARDKATQVRVAALEQAKALELQNLNERRDQLGQKMDEQLALLQMKLANHPEQFRKNNAAIIKLLNTFGVDYKTSGENLGKAFARGMDAAQDEVRKSAAALARIVAQYWKANSPTEKGPMSTLDKWWKPVPQTLISGLDMRPITNAFNSMTAPAAAAPVSLGAGAATVGMTGGGNVYVTLNAPNYVGDKMQLIELIKREVTLDRKRGGTAFGAPA